MSITELVAKLRSTKSESKRKLLDEAADTIERLEFERDALAYRLGVADGEKYKKAVELEWCVRKRAEDLSDGALD